MDIPSRASYHTQSWSITLILVILVTYGPSIGDMWLGSTMDLAPLSEVVTMDGAMVDHLDRVRCSPNVAQLASTYPWRAMQRLASIWYDLGALQHHQAGQGLAPPGPLYEPLWGGWSICGLVLEISRGDPHFSLRISRLGHNIMLHLAPKPLSK